MLAKFWAIRSIRDVRDVRDCIAYGLKYVPAICSVVSVLAIETQHRISGWTGVLTAWACVFCGVEVRAAIRRRWRRRVSPPLAPGSESSATPLPNT